MSPSEVCLGYLAAFASADPQRIVAFVTEDFVNDHTAALGSSCRGRSEYANRVPGFLTSMPELRYDVEEVIAEGDRVVVAYTLLATVNDRPIRVRGIMRFVVNGELIAQRTDYWDSNVFLKQAGLG